MKRAMDTLSIYDEKRLERLVRRQQEHAWDLERSIAWNSLIDLNKPLVPLDESAIACPGAGSEERLALSQMMGLIIASSICEMESCLIRLRKEAFDDVYEGFPVSPEFRALGEQFFTEEHKHSRAFRRYLDLFADTAGIEPGMLRDLLPLVEDTRVETVLKESLRWGGQGFWWIVATVEEEFLSLYARLSPFQDSLEPLYFDLHQKHFEEEARHSPFPYLMLELLRDRGAHWVTSPVDTKGGLMFAQIMIASWSVASLAKVRKIKSLNGMHPMFDALAAAYKLLENQPPARVLWRFFTSAPYVSSLVNPASHRRVLRTAGEAGAMIVPFPEYEPEGLVDY